VKPSQIFLLARSLLGRAAVPLNPFDPAPANAAFIVDEVQGRIGAVESWPNSATPPENMKMAPALRARRHGQTGWQEASLFRGRRVDALVL
jgi:hypothetical protein